MRCQPQPVASEEGRALPVASELSCPCGQGGGRWTGLGWADEVCWGPRTLRSPDMSCRELSVFGCIQVEWLCTLIGPSLIQNQRLTLLLWYIFHWDETYFVSKYWGISVGEFLKLIIIIFPTLQPIEVVSLVHHCSIHLVAIWIQRNYISQLAEGLEC